jgi:carbonic anhydrase
LKQNDTDRISPEESVKEDLALLRAHPLIKKDIQLIGLKYDIVSGLLSEVQVLEAEDKGK